MWKIETFVTQFFRENQFWWMKNVRKIQFGEILDPLNYSFNEFVQILKARNLLTSSEQITTLFSRKLGVFGR